MTTTRRNFIGAVAGAPAILRSRLRGAGRRPNLLFAISDDQSWAHTGVAGDKVVKTPAFDRVARAGVHFTNAVTASPGCAPSRAAILTGRVPWQLEEAGTHASHFPRKFQVYPDTLAKAGYHVGLTGKGAGWPHNPAGPDYQSRKATGLPKGINSNDYAANFEEFLGRRRKDQPFCFWYGASEPHRVFEEGVGLRAGKRLEDVKVPSFLPDVRVVRSDILDYCYEIEHFDRHLGRMLDLLEKSGELENTLVVATSDNGMAFPGAKATMREYGIHMPLAVCWQARAKGGRTVDDLISFTDFAPTFLSAAGLTVPGVMTGRSFLEVLASGGGGRVDAARTSALSGRERHSHSRFDNLGYPARAIRTARHLYIRNFKPERWPMGAPADAPLEAIAANTMATFSDHDASPTKAWTIEHRRDAAKQLYHLTFEKRPGEELYDLRRDPDQMNNVAADAAYAKRKSELAARLMQELRETKDPRLEDDFDRPPYT